jgi:limonene-1,2-epoxide hydrolase
MTQTPKDIVMVWGSAFNAIYTDAIARLYHNDAVNHQIAYGPMEGRVAIKPMFETEFSRAKMVYNIENLFEDGELAILEWSDPLGLRGCGFFHVIDGKIKMQRGYFDKLSFYRAQGLPLEDA